MEHHNETMLRVKKKLHVKDTIWSSLDAWDDATRPWKSIGDVKSWPL